MTQTTDNRSPDGARPARNDTASAQGERQAIRPRTPNEHDESADSQSREEASQRSVGKAALDDLKQGHQDTSKHQETDAAYDRVVGHEKK
ncbi:hypothetical protein LZ009_23585 [Ramlibacter sp. XY19]|uniref:hypothetical protein n=1 Tax=Ramlibacter paludis TaxID=2908000 RepID=UPI0023DBF87C|nr:hypothetical protein [Ramlibacter paludis]MCG2595772.1 hypothetical protein [Ramlibacter paludis]